MAIRIGQLKDHLREALQSAFESRCGLGASGEAPVLILEASGELAFAAPDAMTAEHIAAANLLARLVDDVDNLDPVVGATVLALLNSYDDPTAIFHDGRFKRVIEAIGRRNSATGERWRPLTVTAALRHALATAQI